jgi:tetratricopeptide (TPR) repeat protein
MSSKAGKDHNKKDHNKKDTKAPRASARQTAPGKSKGPVDENDRFQSLSGNLLDLSDEEAGELLGYLIKDGGAGAASIGEAIDRLGLLIDLSDDLEQELGVQVAIQRGEALLARDLAPREHALIHYFLGNAWEATRRISRKDEALDAWEQPEFAQQIIHLRHAIRLGDGELEPLRLCQIYTNLGNLMSHCGRVVDAVAYWDRALTLDPDFAMALGNRGCGLLRWAQLIYDPGHRIRFARQAYSSLVRALAPDTRVHQHARTSFEEYLANLQRVVPAKVLQARSHSHKFPKRMGRQERAYRTWCLADRLFLNDLNELDPDPIGAADVLSLPSLTTSIHSGPPNAIGFFNQLKQEYVTARYMYYEGTQTGRAHFSDRWVTLVNTLDYPAYGLPVEQVKIAFRLAYSILDKVAYFLNDYLSLQIPERNVSFRSLWYDRQEPARGLRTDIHRTDNWPLKGLFWLAKDLYEKDAGFTEAIEPDGKEVADIRNHIEHKYFKLHVFGPWPVPEEGPPSMRGDLLARSMDRGDFERRTLRLLRTARAALIYVALGVFVEERRRQQHKGKVKMPMALTLWEDDWKF